MKLWGTLRKKHKLIASQVTEIDSTPEMVDEDWLHEAIGDMCSEMDISRPLVLKKHVDDFNKFLRVVFKKDDFIENVVFDQFVLELIDEEKKSKQTQNEFYD